MYAKVIAVNAYGETVESTEGNGATYTRVPDSPINLTEDNSVRTSTENGLTWNPGAHNGGLTVQDYRINQKEQGASSYSVIATGVVTASYTISGLTLGTTYEFTVEARNSGGFSLPSSSVTIFHAMAPE